MPGGPPASGGSFAIKNVVSSAPVWFAAGVDRHGRPRLPSGGSTAQQGHAHENRFA